MTKKEIKVYPTGDNCKNDYTVRDTCLKFGKCGRIFKDDGTIVPYCKVKKGVI